MSKYVTLVAVGDGDSKKTDLLLKYTGGGSYSSRYDNMLLPKFQSNIHSIIVDHVRRTIHFVDTEPDDDYKILRKTAYEQADCILMCYSVKVKSTYKSIYKKWCLEVRKHAPFVPIILIGTEIEACNNSPAVSTEQGENLKLLIGAYAFIECSIEHFLGVDDIFIEAVRSTCQRRCYK